MVTWRGEYVGGHLERGICWGSLGGGNILGVPGRDEYFGVPLGKGNMLGVP